MSNPNILQAALTRLDEAARHVQIDSDVLEKLKYPRETMKVRLLIRMDDGSRKSFLAWRCRYDDTRGPTKGGIRFHPDSTVDEVETLAFWMTVKCAVTNLPYGGGKGAVQVDPKTLSKAELERLSRAYVQAFANIIGPDRDIPAPDVYTNAMIMGWMADEYATIKGEPHPGVITGKPIALGGSLGRDDATARGGFYLTRHLTERLGLPTEGLRVVVQGFGNAGQHAARLFRSVGAKIVAVSDSRGAVYAPGGLDLEALLDAKNNGKSVLNAAHGGKEITADELIGLDTEVLVPSAMEDMIHDGNAGQVKAKVVLELANGPITPAGDAILAEKGVIVLPDILANAGGVTVSYFEWVQNRQGYYWTLDEVHTRLKSIIENEGDVVWKIAEDKKVTLRTAAYIHALNRLATAIEAHGTQQFFTS
ncbi:Glu/Leu/Phe/Val dehydrogenase [uncultured Brevundimonas sp.]|uniref:Glu/Leu/Phe/Val family dehydrogenase n=1 Tax=uncultured Brevundimonas sp. TaxID=213418 RepID=UPI00260D8F13|nr:Glu/Leu/Phe/Val dehydrogenase [uncultured Brevundimonas sp.]